MSHFINYKFITQHLFNGDRFIHVVERWRREKKANNSEAMGNFFHFFVNRIICSVYLENISWLVCEFSMFIKKKLHPCSMWNFAVVSTKDILFLFSKQSGKNLLAKGRFEHRVYRNVNCFWNCFPLHYLLKLPTFEINFTIRTVPKQFRKSSFIFIFPPTNHA